MDKRAKRRLTLFAAVIAGASGQAFAAGPIFRAAPGVALEPRPEVADAWFATVDLGPILEFEAGRTDGTIQIPVTADITLNARITRADRRGAEDASWGGELTDIDQGSFVFAQYADGFFGAVWAPGLGTFEVRWSHQRDNDGRKIFSVLELNPEGFDPCGVGPEHIEMPPGAIDQIPAAIVGPQPETEQHAAFSGPIADERGLHRFTNTRSVCTPLCTDDGSVIDILIAYTPAARAAAGSDADIRALIRAAVDATNDAYGPSEINTRLNLVYTHFTDYDESDGTNSNHLSRIRGVNNGFMDEVHPLRNRYRADLVALITDTGGSCGVAYLAPFNAASGFSVTRWSCAVGNLTFAHEVGHNQGCAHDADNANSSVFSYGFGWRFTGTNGVLYRTVMAYSPGSRVPRFSNPDVNFQGTPTGAPNANNVRAINNTRTSIAGFRLTGGTDCNDNGIDDFLEIAQNPSLDLNNNCILDECEVPIFVDASAPPGGDGKTWATAFRDLNSILFRPRDRCDIPREIWVAAGTYVPLAPGSDPRASTFHLSNGDRLIGGFGGFEQSIAERDPALYPTILSGDILGDDGPNFTNRTDNVYSVVTIEPGSGPETVIDGFTIRGGNADGSEAGQNLGAGVMVDGGASVTIRNTVIEDNNAGFGAGVYLRDAIGVVIEDSVIRDNLAASQGAAVRALRSGVTIERTRIIANTSSLDGGALSFNSSTLEADRVEFAGNTGRLGGAYYADGGSTLISNSVFSGNQSTNLGGGAYVTRADTTHRFVNSTFTDNTASNNGGAIRAWNTNFNAENSIFAFNLPQNITEGSLGTKQVRHSLVTGGYSGAGNINAQPVFVDRLGPDGVPGTGDENLALTPGSPGIDAGNNNFAVPGRDLDFAGADRFFDDPNTPNTGVGEAPIIDMGAHEFQPTTPACPPDLNNDGVVDADDFFLFLQLFAAGDSRADFNNDGVIDADDFFAFLSAFADGCP